MVLPLLGCRRPVSLPAGVSGRMLAMAGNAARARVCVQVAVRRIVFALAGRGCDGGEEARSEGDGGGLGVVVGLNQEVYPGTGWTWGAVVCT